MPYDFENSGGTNMACSSARCEEYLAIDLANLRRQGILSSGLPAFSVLFGSTVTTGTLRKRKLAWV